MLANSFLKPEQLGITEAEFSAALRVLNMLERAELVFAASGCALPDKRGFHMSAWSCLQDRDECGTVACIGGWMQIILGQELSDGCHDKFRELFFPNRWLTEPDVYTVEASAQALRNMLTFGEPRWAEALADVSP